MVIAKARAEHIDEPPVAFAARPPMVAIVGEIEMVAHRLASRLTSIVPDTWQCRQFGRLDAARADHGDIALVALVCADSASLDIDALTKYVDGCRPAVFIVVGRASNLPTHGQAIRAGVLQRIDTDEPSDVIDAGLRQAVAIAAERQRLIALERAAGTARAVIRNDTIQQASPAFARLLGAESADEMNGQRLAAWLSEGDATRLNAAIARLTHSDTGLGVVLRRAEAGTTSPLSAHLQANADQSVGLSLAPLEATSVPILGSAPIADARMALHRHLASISRWSESGRLRGLVCVVIDGVATMQQQFGLARTDELLQDVGLYLIDRLRDVDRCFRFATGEYILSIERDAPHEISAIARQLIHALGETEFGTDQRSIHLTASVSAIALGPESTNNDRRLRQLVDTAYRVREDGGDQFRECEGDPIVDARAGHDTWQTRLEQALTDDRFQLAFQTVTSLAGDHRRYYDALLRYVDDHEGLVVAGQFLPAAESLGLMPRIDRWVARRAAEVVADQAARSMEVALFVKISPNTLENGDAFAEWLENDASMRTIDRQQLVFCVREADARSHVAAARRLNGALARAGFRFALTHFGETQHHVSMLDNMTLSFIKLAPAFARQLAEHNSDDPRLERVVTYAREHQTPLIAEHIEDAASMARLWQAGVNYVQGHFIQEPDIAAMPRAGET